MCSELCLLPLQPRPLMSSAIAHYGMRQQIDKHNAASLFAGGIRKKLVFTRAEDEVETCTQAASALNGAAPRCLQAIGAHATLAARGVIIAGRPIFIAASVRREWYS
eukprot:3935077-Pleurochrysis_carterae.AAC.4